MSTVLRSILVVVALLATASAASAHSYGYGHDAGHAKVGDAWKQDARTFFDEQQRNGS